MEVSLLSRKERAYQPGVGSKKAQSMSALLPTAINPQLWYVWSGRNIIMCPNFLTHIVLPSAPFNLAMKYHLIRIIVWCHHLDVINFEIPQPSLVFPFCLRNCSGWGKHKEKWSNATAIYLVTGPCHSVLQSYWSLLISSLFEHSSPNHAGTQIRPPLTSNPSWTVNSIQHKNRSIDRQPQPLFLSPFAIALGFS